MSSTKKRNLKIYNDCLNGCYENKEIEPLINTLYLFVDNYNYGLNLFLEKRVIIDGLADDMKSEFMDNILDLFKKIINDHNEEAMIEYLDIIRKYKIKWDNIIDYLYAIMYPLDFYKKNSKKYFEAFHKFTDFYINDEVFSSNTKIERILKIYGSYIEIRHWSIYSCDLSRIDFNYIATIALAVFYFNDFDENELFGLIDYIYNNMPQINDYLTLNNGNNEEVLYEYLVSTLLSNMKETKKVIN